MTKTKVEQWFKDRGLDKADPYKQTMKLVEEFGELTQGIVKNNQELIVDSIGDMAVVLIGLCLQTDTEIELDDNLLIFETELQHWEFLGRLVSELPRTVRLKDYLRPDVMMIVNCLNWISEYYGTTLESALKVAYEEIKDRKGKLINGVFVKEQDL